MHTTSLPKRLYLPQIAKRWELEESETIAFFIGHNIIYTLFENVQRQVFFHEKIDDAIKEAAKKKGEEVVLPSEEELELFTRVPVMDEYLEAIIKHGFWSGHIFIHDFEGTEEGEIFQAALVFDNSKVKNMKISADDLYVSSNDLLKLEKELGHANPLKSKAKSTKLGLDPRAEKTYLNIIGALLEVTTGTFRDESFSSETELRDFIAEKYAGFRGLAARTLAEKFALAKKALNGKLD